MGRPEGCKSAWEERKANGPQRAVDAGAGGRVHQWGWPAPVGQAGGTIRGNGSPCELQPRHEGRAALLSSLQCDWYQQEPTGKPRKLPTKLRNGPKAQVGSGRGRPEALRSPQYVLPRPASGMPGSVRPASASCAARRGAEEAAAAAHRAGGEMRASGRPVSRPCTGQGHIGTVLCTQRTSQTLALRQAVGRLCRGPTRVSAAVGSAAAGKGPASGSHVQVGEKVVEGGRPAR
jgi:hypothetical protein